MATIREVIQMAMVEYDKYSYMCNEVESLNLSPDDIKKTTDFIEVQLKGKYTLTDFLSETSPEYKELCHHHLKGYESEEPFAYRVKWWNEVTQLPEAQV